MVYRSTFFCALLTAVKGNAVCTAFQRDRFSHRGSLENPAPLFFRSFIFPFRDFYLGISRMCSFFPCIGDTVRPAFCFFDLPFHVPGFCRFF